MVQHQMLVFVTVQISGSEKGNCSVQLNNTNAKIVLIGQIVSSEISVHTL